MTITIPIWIFWTLGISLGIFILIMAAFGIVFAHGLTRKT